MLRALILQFICLLEISGSMDVVAQEKKVARPYRCGFLVHDISSAQSNYQNSSQYFRCQPGERIASVGASNGYIETQIALWVDSIQWTIQDIDSACLVEFPRVRAHFEKLAGRPISATFDLVLGTSDKTNLPNGQFDRILLSNVYHELTDRDAMMRDLYTKLKPAGVIVIMERMGRKKGERHKDCGHVKLFEPDFIQEMHSFSFRLQKKEASAAMPRLQFFTFEAIR
ncbi:MAG: class I SAM-dependent methyltransferase [Cyclobacteriaceae bacterium]|jgi:2-polyprenyl-3-methyl-5-hydroxy-6-metoxy-1,4-benzoquinol methylase|nr:class I SAM-dependent methyltransferase [Cyclobacteriaceae bacterium]